jgi:hypothetical protein
MHNKDNIVSKAARVKNMYDNRYWHKPHEQGHAQDNKKCHLQQLRRNQPKTAYKCINHLQNQHNSASTQGKKGQPNSIDRGKLKGENRAKVKFWERKEEN